MKVLINWLRDPLLRHIDVNGCKRFELHKIMLQRKGMLRQVFFEFHDIFRSLEDRFLTGLGLQVELGAGISPIRDSYPEVLATDIVGASHLDMIINSEAMNFDAESVKTVYCQNCFHHFPHPERFFNELERVLVPGGGAILLEPYYGRFASFLYERLFQTEGFDKTYPSWDTPVDGPMNGANQALSYIVFVRDRVLYEKKYPCLEIVYQGTVGNYLKYLLSGGLNFRQILPDSLTRVVGLTEKIIFPLNKLFALHHVIVIRKVAV